jgi:hypothetical protein
MPSPFGLYEDFLKGKRAILWRTVQLTTAIGVGTQSQDASSLKGKGGRMDQELCLQLQLRGKRLAS